ncbi:conserved hypothetical protein [delta proteobacterium NaphS2]|nr:conserved hypothetical protein [delta proteobacterium NaphS2]
MKKLRVKAAIDVEEKIIDLEEAKDWDFGDPHALVVVDRKLARSYEELVDIVSSDRLKDKEIIEINFMMTCTGG